MGGGDSGGSFIGPIGYISPISLMNKSKALEKIAEEIRCCRTCKRGKIGVAVPGEGNPDADIVFLGEAPGKEEAKCGRPFVGRAGKILRALIADAGLKDADVYITSPVKYLPKYVTPKPADIAHGRKHLQKQLAIIKPKIVVLLGNTACQAMLGEKFAIALVHGTMIERDNLRYLICYHPAAQLHQPRVRPLLIQDFKKLKKMLKLC